MPAQAPTVATHDQPTDDTVLGTYPILSDPPDPLPWGWCLAPRKEWANPDTGVIEQKVCDKNTCAGCAVRRAFKIGIAVAAASPTVMLTLTCAGTSWKDANGRWGRFRRILGRTYDFEAAYVVERGLGCEVHVHALCRGDLPRHEVLSEVAQEAGFGWDVDATELWSVKGVAEYVTKRVNESLIEHLDLNGGWLIHATRKFWTIDGEVIPKGWKGVARRLNKPTPSAKTTRASGSAVAPVVGHHTVCALPGGLVVGTALEAGGSDVAA